MTFRLLALLCLFSATTFGQERFKDRLWLWCHVAGAHNDGAPVIYNDLKHQKPTIGRTAKRANPFRFHHEFAISPEAAAQELGLENVLMVKYNLGPNPGPSPE